MQEKITALEKASKQSSPGVDDEDEDSFQKVERDAFQARIDALEDSVENLSEMHGARRQRSSALKSTECCTGCQGTQRSVEGRAQQSGAASGGEKKERREMEVKFDARMQAFEQNRRDQLAKMRISK